MVQLRIDLTDVEMERLNAVAHDYGFDTAEEYLKLLALGPSNADLLDDIHEGLLAAWRGETMPTQAEMWQALNDDEDR